MNINPLKHKVFVFAAMLSVPNLCLGQEDDQGQARYRTMVEYAATSWLSLSGRE